MGVIADIMVVLGGVQKVWTENQEGQSGQLAPKPCCHDKRMVVLSQGQILGRVCAECGIITELERGHSEIR